MAMVENSVTKSLYKIELYLIKIIPTIIAGCYLLNNVLSYFNIETSILSAIGGLSILPWTFLFISSFVFKNSIIHEAEHIKQSMLYFYQIDDSGEPPAYTVGYIASQMIKKFNLYQN